MDENLNDLDMILFNLRTAAGGDTITFEDLAKIVLLYTLPKGFEHLRHEVESKNDGTYSLAKETIRSYEKSSVFAASLSNKNTSQDQALLSTDNCEHSRPKKNCWNCDP